MKREASRFVAIGVSALSVWVVLFAAGLLLDSEPYRNALAPPHTPGVAAGVPDGDPASLPKSVRTFVCAALFYTPVNAAGLAMLAALVGGCASRLATRDGEPPKLDDPIEQARAERRFQFLTESPAVSMLRGFAVYLSVIAGVSVIGASPFATTTAESYLRLAGTLSLLAFAVGYDPSRLQDLLDGLPRAKKR